MRSKNKNLAKAKADKYFSLFIRERDRDKPCITCGKLTSKKDCGHFISRRFESTRYDEKNCGGQCLKCNRFEYGNQFAFSLKIDKLYGDGTAKRLHEKSLMFCKRNQNDYEEIAKEYKSKYEHIKNK